MSSHELFWWWTIFLFYWENYPDCQIFVSIFSDRYKSYFGVYEANECSCFSKSKLFSVSSIWDPINFSFPALVISLNAGNWLWLCELKIEWIFMTFIDFIGDNFVMSRSVKFVNVIMINCQFYKLAICFWTLNAPS